MLTILLGYLTFLGSFFTDPDFRQLTYMKASVAYVANETGHGSGFVVEGRSKKRYIVTNAHVCKTKSQDMKVKWGIRENDEETSEAPIEIDSEQDICILTLRNQAKLPLRLSDTFPAVGEPVYTVGFPGTDAITLTQGTVELTNAVAFLGDTIYLVHITTTVGKPGSSGSPLFNSEGKVVGVMFGDNGRQSVITPLTNLQIYLRKL